eukprot:TRINITY_DN2836_c0_g1_i1.p1 TRINITY_DN2836_c0_g1~~TRINITY_DN2836_c0_g1_i1.p1  ORF type:complete len:601 (-),score=131.34 TRINITY_DN2836_c0_g1_i1:1153-2955(-)
MEDQKNNNRETPSLEKSSVEVQEVPLFSAHPPMVIEDDMMIGVHDMDRKEKKTAKYEIPENNKTENRPPSDRNVKETAPLNTTKEIDTAKHDPNAGMHNNAFDNIETIPIAKQEEEEKKKVLARKDSTQNGEETKDGKAMKNDVKVIAEEKKQSPGSFAITKKSTSLKFSTAAEALRRPPSMAKKQTVVVEVAPLPAWKKKITRFVESPLVSIILGLWTIYTLFGDDRRLIGTAKESDGVFFVLMIIAICFFTAEILLSSIAIPEYLLGFNFLIDSVCTLTMLMDIGWLWEPVLSKGYSDPESHPVNTVLLADASKDARLGYATTIHIRVLRLVRLVRILKIYKYTFSAYDKMKVQDRTDADEIRERAEKDEPGARKNTIEDAKIGNLLSDVTIKRIVFMVIILMFSVPLFSFRSYTSDARSFEFGLDLLGNFNDNSNGAAFLQAYDSYLYNHLSYRNPIILVRAPGKSYDSPTVDFTKLRFNEKEIINPSDSKLHGLYIAVFDLRTDTQMDALLGILQTIFVCLMLAIGGFFFTKDATDLVVAPIEQMMRKIKRIVGNPLEVVNQEEKEAIAYQQKKRAEKIIKKQRCCQRRKKKKWKQ